jgi:D-arabinose 5-phosphate isomerase GutQ
LGEQRLKAATSPPAIHHHTASHLEFNLIVEIPRIWYNLYLRIPALRKRANRAGGGVAEGEYQMAKVDYMAIARQIFKREGRTITRLADTIDGETFNAVVTAVVGCKRSGGRIITTGRGNSSAVARKIAYSLCCVDVPSVFQAPGEGFHASTGLIQPGDLLIAVSRGGDSTDVIELMKMARQKSAKIVAVTANPASTMALMCDIMLRVSIDRDIDTHDYLDTSSMLAMMAVFDAVALAIQPGSESRDFNKE